MYEKYLDKSVLIFVDGRGAHNDENYETSTSVSLVLEGKILEEAEQTLHLDEVTLLNNDLPSHIYRGSLNKGYVIGIFEKIRDGEEREE